MAEENDTGAPADDLKPVDNAAPDAGDPPADAKPVDDAKPADAAPDGDQSDWRKLLAGEDAEAIKQLERFTDPQALLKSYNEAQKAIREGGKVKIPGKDATPEEIAAWNKARGVPEKIDGYKITAKPPEGYEVSDADKASLAMITERLFKAGVDNTAINAAHEAYYALAEAAAEQFLERSAEIHAETEAQLKKLWVGHRYAENMQWANAAVSQFGLEKIMDLPMHGGGLLGSHPDFIKAIAAIGRLNAEDPYFLKAANSPGAHDPDARLKELQGLYRTNPKEYQSEKVQGEIASILAAKERRESRAN